jgi:hypothetical protein
VRPAAVRTHAGILFGIVQLLGWIRV